MTATATRAAAPTAAVPLTLDDRLALTGLAMDNRLDHAAADMAIRTAHIDTEHPPIFPTPAPGRPLAELLHRAAARVEAGWSRETAGHDSGPVCAAYAIELEAGGDARLHREAWDLLRQAIPGAESIPAWNRRQAGAGAVAQTLRQAARLAS